jgi:uncharacterized membrane protein
MFRNLNWSLMAACLVGLILRGLNLTGKPLWMDEVITTLFSFGQSYDRIPVGQVLSVEMLMQFLTFRLAATCTEIATNVMSQSVHPPLFFCGMHAWLKLFDTLWGEPNWLTSNWLSWVWVMRSASMIAGTLAIGLAYALARLAWREARHVGTIAITTAWIMAVSPFAVYLSQEARHYTWPMLVVMLGLLGLLKIQQDWQRGKINPWVWVGWTAVQTLGFYLHYFALLATAAQIGALVLWIGFDRRHRRNPSSWVMGWVPIALMISAFGFTVAPWWPIFLSHVTNRPETNWLKPAAPTLTTILAPLWQLPMAWLSMIVAFPVEGQPLIVVLPTAIAMLMFAGWIGRSALEGLGRRWRDPATRDPSFILVAFLGIMLSLFGLIIFGLQKDISQVPRYGFIYYPAVCLLLGAGLSSRTVRRAVILVGVLSGLLINANLVFQKPFHPDRLAANITHPANPTTTPNVLVAMGYNDYQELALGLSFVLALRTEHRPEQSVKFVFLDRSRGYDAIFSQFSTLPSVDEFWLIAPGLRQKDFPNLTLVGQRNCGLVSDRYYRLGIPYQGYACQLGTDRAIR